MLINNTLLWGLVLRVILHADQVNGINVHAIGDVFLIFWAITSFLVVSATTSVVRKSYR